MDEIHVDLEELNDELLYIQRVALQFLCGALAGSDLPAGRKLREANDLTIKEAYRLAIEFIKHGTDENVIEFARSSKNE